MKLLDKEILQIAVPSIVSNVTVPLLGLVDTAITGHLGAAAYIAAIAVGTSIFSLCYWVFSFLRMGTGGLTAQAFGRKSWIGCKECLYKAMTIAIVAGVGIILLQSVIVEAAMMLMDTTPEVEHWARVYFNVLVWGAPANLGLSAMNGWFIGMQDAKSPMTIAVAQNILNIAASTALVFGLGWKVEGVAAGTLIAQWAGFAAAWIFVIKHVQLNNRTKLAASNAETGQAIPASSTSGTDNVPASPLPHSTLSWGKFFSVNKDIFLRTVCLVAVMFSFTAFGARQGDTTLAVNALLMQLFLLVSYIMDGFAYAGEALGGKLLGAKDRSGFELLTKRLFVWGAGGSILFCTFFYFGGDALVALLTDNAAVRSVATQYLWATRLIPIVSLGAFIYDGLFIGTTSTKEMLISIAIATAGYFIVALSSTGNHFLWLAFLLYLGLRGGVQHLQMRNIIAKRF